MALPPQPPDVAAAQPSISPSVLVIGAVLGVVLLASLTIHLFLRCLCRRSINSAGGVGVQVAPTTGISDKASLSGAELVDSLPVFTLSSALAALPKSSPDCAVCQSPFGRDEELRLLPACRHAFHSRCVDCWLKSNPSCPLCRASIALPYPPLPDVSRSGSFRVEIGSISRRRQTAQDNSADASSDPAAAPAVVRSYALPGSDAEFLVEGEVEVELLATRIKETKPASETATASSSVAAPPPANGGSSSRFSGRWSGRWSSRWSRRYDGNAATDMWWYDTEAAQQQPRDGEEGAAGVYTFLRWLAGS